MEAGAEQQGGTPGCVGSERVPVQLEAAETRCRKMWTWVALEGAVMAVRSGVFRAWWLDSGGVAAAVWAEAAAGRANEPKIEGCARGDE